MKTSELNRYARQIKLPNVGIEGQQKLKDSKILVIGAGGLGSPVLLYLAAAGVGTLGIVEFDTIDISNLQRQILYESQQKDMPKLETSIEKLKKLNPEIEIIGHNFKLNAENCLETFKNYEIIIDGSDNFPTRYLVNDACEILSKPYIYGALYQFEGQASVFNYNGSSTYRDLFPTPPPPEMAPNCAESGVFGPLAGIIGSIQANEAIKLITGIGKPLTGQILIFDSLEVSFRKIRLQKNLERPPIKKFINYENFCGLKNDNESKTTLENLESWKSMGVSIMLIDVREPFEHEDNNIGGKNIPLDEVKNTLQEELMTFDKVVYYCASGQRALKAVEISKPLYPEKEFYYLENAWT